MPGIDTGAPDRTETRSGIVDVAESLAGDLLETLQRGVDFGAKRVGNLSLAQVVDAERAGDREARRHRHAEVRHLGEVRALAAEDGLHVLRSFGLAVAEEVDGLRLGSPGDVESSRKLTGC